MVDEQSILDGGGNAGAILRRVDWSATSIGRPEGWPEALRVAVRIVLTTNHPMLIWWGDELLQFYNDGFRALTSSRLHSQGLGTSDKTSWGRTWDIFRSDIHFVLEGKGGIWRQDQPIPTDQSSTRYWTYSLSPIHDHNKVGGVLLVCRDETLAVQEKLAQQAREMELVRIEHILGVGGLEVKLSSGFHNRRSPGYLMIHGLPPGEANESHENWVRRIHPEDSYRAETEFLDAIRGRSKGYSIEYRIVRPSDGKIRWISAKTEIERDRSGNAIRLIGAHTDVTDQVDLRAIERARFTVALDGLRCAVMLTDANGVILYANRSAEDMMEEGSSVRRRHNTLSAVMPNASSALNKALKSAVLSDRLMPNTTVKLTEDDALPVLAHVMPLANSQFASRLNLRAVAAVFIRGREDAQRNATLLAAVYELTSAETRVVAHLLAGRSLPETARELRVAPSTVRSHLDVIFRKTGVGRQSELILLALQLSPPVNGP